jgi:hypothetical protein
MGRIAVGMMIALCGACAGEPVGEPCAPEQVPEDGFDLRETYVEVGSLQCETRTCLVYGLDGDLDQPDAHERVYCSCRCAGGDPSSQCQCPTGFRCEQVLAQGGPGVEGGYCVRNR